MTSVNQMNYRVVMQQNILIGLLKAGLGVKVNIAADECEDIDWQAIYRAAAEQGVAAIVWDGIEKLIAEGCISPAASPQRAVRLQWALAVEQTEARYAKQRRAIVHLADIYAEEHIAMMILKGYGLSLLYPRPEHRACSDIDIWLFGQQRRADEALRTKHNIVVDNGRHHHTIFRIDGVLIENHYDFLNTSSHRSNRDIEALLKQQATEGVAIEVDGRTVYTPNANCHALFLLRHAAVHFAAVEIVLRHIIDWALFVKHHHNDIDWSWLRGICRRHNMELFLDVMNGLAAELADIDIHYMPDTVRRVELEHRVLADILTPEFTLRQPESGLCAIVWYKCRRWWANRWKHRIVYRDGLVTTFFRQVFSHAKKPKSIKQL